MAARKMATKGERAAWTPDKTDARGRSPALLGELLVGAAHFAARQTGAAMTHDQWRAMVGPRIANRTRVGRLARGQLVVLVANSAWSNELSFIKSELIQKLQASGIELTDIRFRVDHIEKSQKPFTRRLDPSPPPVELPAELLHRLQQVNDPNLRAAIAEAARHSLGRAERSSTTGSAPAKGYEGGRAPEPSPSAPQHHRSWSISAPARGPRDD